MFQPDLKLIQLSDDPWYSGLILKLHIIDPCEIILPHTSFDAKPGTAEGKLIKFLREEFPNLSIARVPRRNFNDGDGLNLVKKFCSDKYNYAKDAVMGKYYALSATSGLIKYLQIMHNIFFKENSLKLDFGTKFAHMQIGNRINFHFFSFVSLSLNSFHYSEFISLFTQISTPQINWNYYRK